uniref:Uncharacterized protein n=1 Tax=Timema tahoe TaxID=61484 RepID=A0A7R9INT1_9NEOP|nr:unnamed protein product [Timema tahoe]
MELDTGRLLDSSGGPRKSSPPPISSRRLTLNWRRSIPLHPYFDMKNEQVNCLSKAQDVLKPGLTMILADERLQSLPYLFPLCSLYGMAIVEPVKTITGAMSTLTPPIPLEKPSSNQVRVDYIQDVASQHDFDYPSPSAVSCHSAPQKLKLRYSHRQGLHQIPTDKVYTRYPQTWSTPDPHRQGLYQIPTDKVYTRDPQTRSTPETHRQGLHQTPTDKVYTRPPQTRSTPDPHRQGLHQRPTASRLKRLLCLGELESFNTVALANPSGDGLNLAHGARRNIRKAEVLAYPCL